MGIPKNLPRLSVQDYDFFSEKYQLFQSVLEVSGFEYVGGGSFRYAYGRGKVIIKIPKNKDGLFDNIAEARAWKKYHSKPTKLGQRLAPCRLMSNGCLMMVKVDIYGYYAHPPDWTKYVDGCQIGWYKGKFVAYDYGLDLPDRTEWEKEWGNDPNSFFTKNYKGSKNHLKTQK